jgi:hypothetical protein
VISPGSSDVAVVDVDEPTSRASRTRSAIWRHRVAAAPYAAVTVAVLAANALYLSGLAKLDPEITRSGTFATVVPGRLPGSYTIDPNDGFTSQALGAQALHQLGHGQFPWWNPLEGMGSPLVGEMQSAASFPLLFLQSLPAGFLLLHLALSLIAGLTTTRFVRVLGLGRPAAATAGILFGLNGSLIWFLNAPSLPVAFIPMLLLGMELAFRAGPDGRFRGVATMAAATWFTLTAGFPEGAYISVLFCGLYLLWRVVSARGYRLRYLGRVALGACTGLAVAAPVVLAFLSYLRTHPAVGGHTGIFGNLHLRPPAWGIMFTPYAYGPIFGYVPQDPAGSLLVVWGNVGGYATVAILFAAIVGMTSSRLLGLRLICIGWLLLCWVKTFNTFFPTSIVNLIPGMGPVAFFRYANPTWIMAMIILAALCVDDLSRRDLRLWRVWLAAGISGLALINGWDAGRTIVHEVATKGVPIHRYFVASYLWGFLSLVVLVAAAVLCRYRRVMALAIVCALLAAEAVVMFGIPSLSAPRSGTPDAGLDAFMSGLARDSADGTDLSRMYAIAGGPNANYGSFYNVASINVNDNPAPALWVQYVQQRLAPSITNGRLASLGGLQMVELGKHLSGYQQAAVSWIIVPRGTQLHGILQTALMLYATTQTKNIYRLTGAADYASAATPGCVVAPRSRTQFDVTCSAPGTLVRRELNYGGWTASVGGRSAAISAYDTFFQSVRVPTGHSVVTFRFDPWWATPSLAISVLGLIILALAGMWPLGWWQRRVVTRLPTVLPMGRGPKPGG